MNGLRCALAIFRGKIILNFGFQESLRTFLKPIFTGRGLGGEQHMPRLLAEPSQSRLRRASSPEGGAFMHLPVSVLGSLYEGAGARSATEGVIRIQTSFRQSLTGLPPPSWREALAVRKVSGSIAKLPVSPKAPPSGELAATSGSRLRGFTPVKPQHLPVPARSSPPFEAERAERSPAKSSPGSRRRSFGFYS